MQVLINSKMNYISFSKKIEVAYLKCSSIYKRFYADIKTGGWFVGYLLFIASNASAIDRCNEA